MKAEKKEERGVGHSDPFFWGRRRGKKRNEGERGKEIRKTNRGGTTGKKWARLGSGTMQEIYLFLAAALCLG